MPNWCSIEMAVLGSPAELKDFRKKWLKAMKRAEENHTWGTYEIYREFGYEEKEILESKSSDYIRGNLYANEREVGMRKEYGSDYITLTYETAWCPMADGFDRLFKKHYKTLRQVYVAEEPGNEFYVNTDEKGKIFPVRAAIYDEEIGFTTFKSEKEAVDYFRKRYVKPSFKGTVINAEDCEKYCYYRLENVSFHSYSY